MMNLIKNYLHKRRRKALEEIFHRNGTSAFHKVMSGLELLTTPLKYQGETYLKISLKGHVELRCRWIDMVYHRLQFLLEDYNRVTSNGSDWMSYPSSLEAKDDVTDRKWLDDYFGTSNEDVARKKLREIFTLLDLYQPVFMDRSDPEAAVLQNQAAHLVRELETIVEHYL